MGNKKKRLTDLFAWLTGIYKKIDLEVSSVIDLRFNIWIPSWISFFVISSLFLIFYLLTQIGTESIIGDVFNNFKVLESISFPIMKNTEANFQNIITIFNGIGAVIVGLSFFVAQSLINKNDPDLGRVLLYRSNFFLLLVMEIYTYCYFLSDEINYFIYFILLIEFCFVLYSIGRTIGILVMNVELDKAKIDMYSSILKNQIAQVYKNEVLFEELRKQYLTVVQGLETKYGSIFKFDHLGIVDYSNDYIDIKSMKNGWIIGIHETKLRKLLEKFSDEIKDMWATRLKKGDNDVNEYLCQLIFLKHPISKITSDTILLKIHKDFYSIPKVKREIDNNLHKIYKYTSLSDSFDNARYELKKLMDRCVNFSREGKILDFESSIMIYEEIIESLYSYLRSSKHISLKFSEESLVSSFYNTFNTVNWLIEDIYKIVKVAIESYDEQILRASSYFPIKLMRLAVRYGDHMIFESFKDFPVFLYEKGYLLGKSEKESKIKSNYLVDRSWRFIKELTDIYLIYGAENIDLSSEDFKSYSYTIIHSFQELMKKSYVNKDLENFKVFFNNLNSIADVETYESYEYDTNTKRREIDFKYLTLESLFGLGSWIFNDVVNEDIQSLEYFELILNKMPSDPARILFIYFRAFKSQEVWDWDKWEFDNDAKGLTNIETNQKLSAFFCFLFSKYFNKSKADILSFVDNLDKNVVSFISENSTYIQSSIIKLEQKVSRMVKEYAELAESFEATQNLIELVKSRKELNELNVIRQADLDLVKVNDFKRYALKNYRESFGIRDLFESYMLIKFEYISNFDQLDKFGINVVFDKSPFIDSSLLPNHAFLGFDDGFEFGRNVKIGETKNVLSQMIKVAETSNLQDFSRKIETFIKDSCPIIFSKFQGIEKAVDESKGKINFIPYWREDFPEAIKKRYAFRIHGVVKNDGMFIPVFNYFDDSKVSEIILFDMKTIGTWKQFLPNKNAERNGKFIENFELDIIAFDPNNERFKNTISSQPKWLKDKGDDKNQLEYLKQKVIICMLESYEFEFNKSCKVLYFKVIDED